MYTPFDEALRLSVPGALDMQLITAVRSKDFSLLGGGVMPDRSTPAISAFLDKLDDEFFAQLERAGCVRLDKPQRDELLDRLYRWVALRMRPNAQKSLERIQRHARELALAVRDYAPGSEHWDILEWPHQRDFCCDLDCINQWCNEALKFLKSMKSVRPSGRPTKIYNDTLIVLLRMIYTNAGGQVAFKWDGDTVGGTFAAFLRVVWETLPSELTVRTSAETFVRRARENHNVGNRYRDDNEHAHDCMITVEDELRMFSDRER